MKQLFLFLSLLFVFGSFQPPLAAMASNAPHVAASYQAETKPLTVKKAKKKWRVKERAASWFQKIKARLHPASDGEKPSYGRIALIIFGLTLILSILLILLRHSVLGFIITLGWILLMGMSIIGILKDKKKTAAIIALALGVGFLIFVFILIATAPVD